MKKLTLFTTLIILLHAGCSQEELSKAEALQTIKQKEAFPKPLDYAIYCSDPQFAKKLINAGLENKGLVTVQQTQKLDNAGEPLIRFTEKARTYLLSTPAAEKALDVQMVKIADEDIEEITGIKAEDDGKSALVEYTTIYKNATPFSALMPADFTGKRMTRHARFSLTENGWELIK